MVRSLVASVTSDVITVHRHAAILEGRLLEARRVYERSIGQHTIWVPSASQGYHYTNNGNDSGDGQPPTAGSAPSPTSPPVEHAPNGLGVVGTSDNTASGRAEVGTMSGANAEGRTSTFTPRTMTTTTTTTTTTNVTRTYILYPRPTRTSRPRRSCRLSPTRDIREKGSFRV